MRSQHNKRRPLSPQDFESGELRARSIASTATRRQHCVMSSRWPATSEATPASFPPFPLNSILSFYVRAQRIAHSEIRTHTRPSPSARSKISHCTRRPRPLAWWPGRGLVKTAIAYQREARLTVKLSRSGVKVYTLLCTGTQVSSDTYTLNFKTRETL